MLPLDEVLENVRAEDPAGIRTWFRRNQPASGGWLLWERVAILGLHRVYESSDEFDRREWALLVATTTEEAVDQGSDASRCSHPHSSSGGLPDAARDGTV
jgi:hypothetical protein